MSKDPNDNIDDVLKDDNGKDDEEQPEFSETMVEEKLHEEENHDHVEDENNNIKELHGEVKEISSEILQDLIEEKDANESITSLGNDENEIIPDEVPEKRYNSRPNWVLSYKFAFLSVHAGVKKWGDRAREASRDTLKMLIKEKVFVEGKHPIMLQTRNTLVVHCLSLRKEMDG